MSTTPGETAPPPERRDGEATTDYLARVLTAEGAPGWMVTYATEGHYDDFKSPLAMPETQLLVDARENNLPTIAGVGRAADPSGRGRTARGCQGRPVRADRPLTVCPMARCGTELHHVGRGSRATV